MIRTATRTAAALAFTLMASSALAQEFTTKRVEFVSGSDRVVGSLYVPAEAKGPLPAVVVEGPQTNNKDMVPGDLRRASRARRLRRAHLRSSQLRRERR